MKRWNKKRWFDECWSAKHWLVKVWLVRAWLVKRRVLPQGFLQNNVMAFTRLFVRVFGLLILPVLLFATFVNANETPPPSPLPIATDLSQLSHQSRQQKIPILLVYSAESCEYCQRLEEDVLVPMLRNGEFRERAIIRKIMIDSVEDIRDFRGNEINAEEFAFQQGVQVTPTLRFVDAGGKDLVAEMIGYNTPDLYGAYVTNAIDRSRVLIIKQE